MALVPAICTQCGAQIEVDNTHEAGICKHCGTAFITEKAINNYTTYVTNHNNFAGANVTLKVDSELERLIKAAKGYEQLGEYSNAFEEYRKIIKEYPQDVRGWLGCIYNYPAFCYWRVNETPSYLGPDMKLWNTAGELTQKLPICLSASWLDSEEVVRWFNNALKLSDLETKEKLLADKRNYIEAMNQKYSTFSNKLSVSYVIELMGHNFVSITGSSYRQSYLFVKEDKLYYISDVKKEKYGYTGFLYRIDNIYSTGEIVFFPLRFAPPVNPTIKIYYIDPNTKELFYQCDAEKTIYTAYLNTGDDTYNLRNLVPGKSGCYIATCVYGSYDCPEVWTLRRFRDYTLDSTWYGRALIKCYYAISPTLVKWFGQTKWFRSFWKTSLDKMVNNLNSKGLSNTEYRDKY